MSSKNIVECYQLFNGADMSGDRTSLVQNVKDQDNAFIIIKWSGSSPVGEIVVQVRNNKLSTGPNSDWVDLDMGAPITINTSSGDHQLVFNELPFTDIRLKYEYTSGSGSLNAYMASKAVGV